MFRPNLPGMKSSNKHGPGTVIMIYKGWAQNFRYQISLIFPRFLVPTSLKASLILIFFYLPRSHIQLHPREDLLEMPSVKYRNVTAIIVVITSGKIQMCKIVNKRL